MPASLACLLMLVLPISPGAAQAPDRSTDQGVPAAAQPAGAPERNSERNSERDTKANYALEIDAPPELARLLKANTLLGRWQYRDDYDPSQRALFIRRMPEEARQVLSTEGYFEPELEISESEYKVEVKVWAGPRTTVNGVTLTLDGEILADRFGDRRERVFSDWQLAVGSFFNQSAWDRAKRHLLDSLRNEGFPRASIAGSRAAVDLEKTSVALSVDVDSGPLMYFGEVSFSGLVRYDQSVMAPLIGFDKGEVYSLDRLLQFQSRLRETLYFTSVTVLPELTALEEDPDRREVDIRVAVTEAQSERLTLGVGYSTDRGVRGQIGWTDRNFRSRAWLLDSKLIVDKVSQQANVMLRTPLGGTRHYYQTGARLERNDIQNNTHEIGSFHVGRGKREGEIEHFASLTYQMDRERVFEGLDVVRRSDQRALVPGYSWNVRRLDSRIYPTRGYTFNAQVSGATEELLSDNTFGRGYLRTLRFVSMPRGSLLSGGMLLLIGEAGAVVADSRDGIPSENLFRAGGSQSVRGYSYQSLGVEQGDAVVGGRYLLAGTIEYQHPLFRDFAGAIFYDRGGVGDKWHEFKTVAGYGVGMRWRTPVGPVNLDIAYGQDVGKLRFHFSIGYTF
jgi:translocation and assembly module TamA